MNQPFNDSNNRNLFLSHLWTRMGVLGKCAAFFHVVIKIWQFFYLVATSSPRTLLSCVSNQQKGKASEEQVSLLLESLTKFKGDWIYISISIFSDHSGTNLEMNNKYKSNTLLNNDVPKNKEKLENILKRMKMNVTAKIYGLQLKQYLEENLWL